VKKGIAAVKEETMYGCRVLFNEFMSENAVIMNPKTWDKIRPIHRRNEVVTTVMPVDPKE
jgi:dihydrofolate reductase